MLTQEQLNQIFAIIVSHANKKGQSAKDIKNLKLIMEKVRSQYMLEAVALVSPPELTDDGNTSRN